MSELYHHGIKGQKWGVHRFQNPDGSLTPEGQARYNKAQEKLGAWKAKKSDSITAKYDKKISKTKSDEKKAKLEAKRDKKLEKVDSTTYGQMRAKQALKVAGGVAVAAMSAGAIAYGVSKLKESSDWADIAIINKHSENVYRRSAARQADDMFWKPQSITDWDRGEYSRTLDNVSKYAGKVKNATKQAVVSAMKGYAGIGAGTAAIAGGAGYAGIKAVSKVNKKKKK